MIWGRSQRCPAYCRLLAARPLIPPTIAMLPMVSLHPEDTTLCAENQPSLRWFPVERNTPVIPQVSKASHRQTRTMPRSKGTQVVVEKFLADGVL